MQTFTDNAGDEWTIEPNEEARKLIATEAGINLDLPMDKLAQALTDTATRYSALWAALRPAFSARGLTRNDFYQRVIRGKVQANAARALIMGLITDETERAIAEVHYGWS